MFRALAAFLLIPALAAAASAQTSAALLSQVQGQVTLVTGASTLRARSLQLVAEGAGLKLEAGAEVMVICAGDRAVRIVGPADWRPSDGCAGGRQLPAGTYRRLVPAQGQVRSFHGSLLAEAPSRSDFDEQKVPTLLSPRSLQRGSMLIGEAAPTIIWNQVDKALHYELVLERRGAKLIHEVAGQTASCKQDGRSRRYWCSLAWPWAPLQEGEEVTLQLRAETSDLDHKIRNADPSKLRLAPPAVRRQVEERLAGVQNLELPPATLELLRADVYADAGLYNEAAAALAAALEARQEPAVAVRLGDLYLGLGLLGVARSRYELAESLLGSTGDNEIRAPLQLGLGRTYIRGKDPEPALAVKHLERAAKLYRGLGMSAEAASAAAEAERAGRGLS